MTVTTIGEVRPIHDVVSSPLNPRKYVDPVKLDELAASIASNGILEPLLVRQIGAKLEIVAGERRFRAAKKIAVKEVPVIIRMLSDVEALEMMAIENTQRQDLHPLEEADGYAALMKADPAYTPKAIAAKIGKSERYVQQRLQLARLDESIKESFLKNHITAGHADLMSRLQPDDQKAALKACFANLYGDNKEQGCISVRQLDNWIQHNVRIRLTAHDPQTALFPELAAILDKDDTGPAAIVEIAGSYLPENEAKKLGVLNSETYRRITGKKDRCKHARRAFIAIGNDRGRVIEICTAKTECRTHWKWEIESAEKRKKADKTKPGTKARAQREESAAAAKKKADDQAKKRRDLVNHRQHVLDRAIALAPKTVPNRPVTALLKLAGWNHGTENLFKSWRDLIVYELRQASFAVGDNREFKRATAIFKAFGLDLEGIDKELTAAQTSAANKSGKKAKAA